MFNKQHFFYFNPVQEFKRVMQFVADYSETMCDTDKIDLIKFVIQLLKNDLQTDYAIDIIYNKSKEIKSYE